jgi:hypothetical protein
MACNPELLHYTQDQIEPRKPKRARLDPEWEKVERSWHLILDQVNSKLPTVPKVRELEGDAMAQLYATWMEKAEDNPVLQEVLDIDHALTEGARAKWSRDSISHRLALVSMLVECVQDPVSGKIELHQAHQDYRQQKNSQFSEKHYSRKEAAQKLKVWRIRKCDVEHWKKYDLRLYRRYVAAWEKYKKTLPIGVIRFIRYRRFSAQATKEMEENLFHMKVEKGKNAV